MHEFAITVKSDKPMSGQMQERLRDLVRHFMNDEIGIEEFFIGQPVEEIPEQIVVGLSAVVGLENSNG